MPIDFKAAADDFWAARARGEYFPKAYENRLTIDDAYVIQLALIDRRVAAGEKHIGWKVGLTAKAVQQLLPDTDWTDANAISKTATKRLYFLCPPKLFMLAKGVRRRVKAKPCGRSIGLAALTRRRPVPGWR